MYENFDKASRPRPRVPGTLRGSRLRRMGGAAAAVLGFAAVTAGTRLDGAPGVSFRISTATRIYPGDTPRPQDDEVMRGRGVAVNGRARIEFLAFTPAPAG